MRKLLFLLSFSFLLFASCSNDNEIMPPEENPTSELQMKVITPPPFGPSGENPNPPSYCFDFPNTNEDFDCGWTRGYSDYVYHYNYIVNQNDYGNCFEVIVGGVLSPSSTSDPALYTVPVSSGYVIPILVKSEFQQYFDYLNSKKNDSDFDLGKYYGYIAFRGAEPLSTNPNCLPGNGFGPN